MLHKTQHVPMNPGDRMGVWTRPTDDCLYIFGFGTYEGDEIINGEPCPVIKFDDKRTMVLHYRQVWYGREQDIRETCSEFDGDVHEVNIEEFLDKSFEPPARSDVGKTKEQRKAKKVEKVILPEHETVFDKLRRLTREAEVERNKVQMFKIAIGAAEEKLEVIELETKAMKSEALAEVERLAGGNNGESSKKTKKKPAPKRKRTTRKEKRS